MENFATDMQMIIKYNGMEFEKRETYCNYFKRVFKIR